MLWSCHSELSMSNRLVPQPRRAGKPRASKPRAVATMAFVIAVIGAGLHARLGAADGWLENWNLHGPQQYSEGRPGTWLDPLRDRNLVVDSDRDSFYDSDSSMDDEEFDLSNFTRPPLDSVDEVGAMTPLLSQAREYDEELADPADAFDPAPMTEPVFDDSPLVSDLPRSRNTVVDAIFADFPSRRDLDAMSYEFMPRSLIYGTYLAGEKEPRLQFLPSHDFRSGRTVWDTVLGGRLGLLRYGTTGRGPIKSFQLDLEGAVFARVLPEQASSMLEGSDYRGGMYGTWKFGRTGFKAGYYHVSSHVGDEYLLANPLFVRRNYVRDSLLFATSYDVGMSSRVYLELGYALGVQGGAKPLEVQIGGEYTPIAESTLRGAPFLAINNHARQEFDFQSGLSITGGWGWQGPETRHRLRLGLNYYNGPSVQYIFFDRRESLLGGGLWVDF